MQTKKIGLSIPAPLVKGLSVVRQNRIWDAVGRFFLSIISMEAAKSVGDNNFVADDSNATAIIRQGKLGVQLNSFYKQR